MILILDNVRPVSHSSITCRLTSSYLWKIHVLNLCLYRSMDNTDQNLIPCPLLNISSDPKDRSLRVQCTWTPRNGPIHSAIKIVVIDIWNQRFDVPSKRFSRYYETREISEYSWFSIFRSPELRVSVSFSDRLSSSSVRLSVSSSVCKLFLFSFFCQEPLGRFQPNFAQIGMRNNAV